MRVATESSLISGVSYVSNQEIRACTQFTLGLLTFEDKYNTLLRNVATRTLKDKASRLRRPETQHGEKIRKLGIHDAEFSVS